MIIQKIVRKSKIKITKAIDSIRIERFIKGSFKNLKCIKGSYNDKRCFIIGNGPSLKKEDLERLKGEITFASHGIYFIFDKTDWRPTYYCAQDCKLINDRISEIEEYCKDIPKFFGVVKDFHYPNFSKDDTIIVLLNEPFVDGYPKFSNDATNGFYEGMTVTYFNIQLAIYMGFKEIYLLGVDHSYTPGREHFSDKDLITNTPQLDKTTFSYKKAKQVCENYNIIIKNATRGGQLEVFDRVNFDSLVGGYNNEN